MFSRLPGITLPLSLIFALLSSTGVCNPVQEACNPEENWSSPFSLTVYAGPASPTPLLDLVRLKIPTLAPYVSFTSALGYVLYSDYKFLAFEQEGSLSFYSEGIQSTSFQETTLLRWLATPWNKVVNSSLAMGIGLSYALSPPQVEIDVLSRSNSLLMHLVFEFAADINSKWKGIFRIHHRSGAYGLFNGVVGGSDFLCLGVRYRM